MDQGDLEKSLDEAVDRILVLNLNHRLKKDAVKEELKSLLEIALGGYKWILIEKFEAKEMYTSSSIVRNFGDKKP